MTQNSYSRRQFLGKSTFSGLGIGLASALAPGLSNASETKLFKKSTTKFNNENAEFRGANIAIGEIMTKEGCDEAIEKAEKVGLNAVFLQLCASVLAQPKWIETACQDWPRWVNEGLIDFAKPMFYHSDDELYRQKIAWYRSFAQNEKYWKKIIPSASGNVRSDDPIVKSGSVRDEAYIPEQGATPLPTEEEARAQLVVNKVHLMREAGLPGVNYFTLRSMSDEVVKMLRDGPWKNPVKCYVPPRRRDPGDQL